MPEFYFTTFSILVQIVGSATSAISWIAWRVTSLSVSSCRSWGVQQSRTSRPPAAFSENFQYPRADRGECNG